MSGQESIRGYLFQSLIAVLESLNKNWKTISIEPKTENDKIDIIWSTNENKIEVCQVKSSIKNFSKNDVLHWLKGLYDDNKKANEYSIYLVGNSSYSTKKYFKPSNFKNEVNFPGEYAELLLIKDKVKVYFEPNNIKTLEDALIAGVDRFLFSKGYQSEYPDRKLIANGMVTEIIKISTKGKNITINEFESILLDWLRHQYSEQLSLNNANFVLKFYFKDNIELLDTISKITMPNIIKTNYYKLKIKEVENLYHKISAYNFKVKNFEKPYDPNDFSSFFSQPFKSSLEYKNEPVIISSYEIDQLSKSCQKILNVKPEMEFFNFGNLKETKTLGLAIPSMQSEVTLKGSEVEKEKRELYNDFYWKIKELTDLLNYWSSLSKLSMIPIVLKNIGKTKLQWTFSPL